MEENEIILPNFRKIKAMIPTKIYDELTDKNKFNENFDTWITLAIIEKLKSEEK